MPGITHIAQIALSVEDVERAKEFYRDILGLEHLFDAPPGLSFFRCGDSRLMLSRPEGVEQRGNSILYYSVPSARHACDALKARGVDFEEDGRCIAKVDGRDVWLAICRDPNGNYVGLMSEEESA